MRIVDDYGNQVDTLKIYHDEDRQSFARSI